MLAQKDLSRAADPTVGQFALGEPSSALQKTCSAFDHSYFPFFGFTVNSRSL